MPLVWRCWLCSSLLHQLNYRLQPCESHIERKDKEFSKDLLFIKAFEHTKTAPLVFSLLKHRRGSISPLRYDKLLLFFCIGKKLPKNLSCMSGEISFVCQENRPLDNPYVTTPSPELVSDTRRCMETALP